MKYLSGNIKIHVSRETLEVKMNEYYMNIAIKEAKKAYKYEEIPVGAVIIKKKKQKMLLNMLK